MVFVRKAMFSIPIIIPKEGCLQGRKNGERSFHFCKTLVAVEYIELWTSCIGWNVKRRHDKGKWRRCSQMLNTHEIWQDRNYSNSTKPMHYQGYKIYRVPERDAYVTLRKNTCYLFFLVAIWTHLNHSARPQVNNPTKTVGNRLYSHISKTQS